MSRTSPLNSRRDSAASSSPSWVSRSLRKYGFLYLLALPGILYFLIFHYVPMFGIVIAFKNISPYNAMQDIFTGPWVGFTHFKRFFDSYYFWDILTNTLSISGLKLLVGFPAPIILALLLTEVRNERFKRFVQTVSYMPHFLSVVVVVSLVTNLLSTSTGPVNGLIKATGGQPISFLTDPNTFVSILVSADVWQNVGWGTILYLAAIAGISPELLEAATMDGANRWQRVRHVTLPSISFAIVILFIFAVGNLLNAGFEQILLLYSPSVYSVADIIDTYVYREGLLGQQYSFAAAVGLFKSAFALFLLLGANALARRLGQTGIW